MALEAARVPAEGYVSTELDPNCRKVTASHVAGCIEVDDVEKVSTEFRKELRRKFPRVCCVLVSGGFPCLDYSALSLQRGGLEA